MAGPSPTNTDAKMDAFLKKMGNVMSSGGGRANGPSPKVKEDTSSMAKDLKRLADSFDDFAKNQAKQEAREKDREENKDRKDQDWQKSLLDAVEANTASGKNKDGSGKKGGFLGSILAGLGGLAASILGPTGIIKAFKTLGHVVGAVYKGGKVFAKVLGKAGSLLVDFTAAVGKAAWNIGKFAARLVSRTFGGAVNLGKRLLGFGGKGATGPASEGSFFRKAGSIFKKPATMMAEAGAMKPLGRISSLAKGAGGAIMRKGFGKAIPILGTAMSAIDLGTQMHDEWKQREDTHGVGWGGVANGALSGGTIGATVGSIIPGVGTAIGGAVGAAVGGGASLILQHKHAIEKQLKHPIKALKDTFKSITNFMQHLWNGTKVAWDRIIYPKLKAFGHVIEVMWTKAEPVLMKVGSVLGKIGNVLGKVVGTIFSSIGSIVKKVVSFVGPGVKWIAKKVGIPVDDLEAVAAAFNAPLASTSTPTGNNQPTGGGDTIGSPPTGDGSTDGGSAAPPPPPDASVDTSAAGASTSASSIPSPPPPVSSGSGMGGGAGGFGGGGGGMGGGGISTGNPVEGAKSIDNSSGAGSGTGIGGDEDLGPFDENRVMATIANAESGGHAGAKNPNGSATGLFQIVKGTLMGVNRVYHTNFSMDDLKDPYKSVKAEEYLLYDQRRALRGAEANDPLRIAIMHAVGPGPYNQFVRGRSVNEGLALMKQYSSKTNYDAANYEVSHMRAGYKSANPAAIQALKDGKEPPRRKDGSIVFMGSGGTVSTSAPTADSSGGGGDPGGGGGGSAPSPSGGDSGGGGGGGGFGNIFSGGGGGTPAVSALIGAPTGGTPGGGGGLFGGGGTPGGGGGGGASDVVSAIKDHQKAAQDNHDQAMQAAKSGAQGAGGSGGFDWDKVATSAVPQDIQILLAKRA